VHGDGSVDCSRVTRREMIAKSARGAVVLAFTASCKSAESVQRHSSRNGFKIGVRDRSLGKTNNIHLRRKDVQKVLPDKPTSLSQTRNRDAGCTAKPASVHTTLTMYIAAYDTERPACLAGVRRIVQVHEKFEMPATFFIVARLLEDQQNEYVALLRDHPLFEIACHSYSHMLLVDTPRFGKAGLRDRLPQELVVSKQMLEDAFGGEVAGFRPPVCAPNGLATATEALGILAAAGYRYVSSVAWGPDFSMPAPLARPFTYTAQGFPNLWEIPPCGWHENLLKGNNRTGPLLLCLFPSPVPEAVPKDYVKTPDEEFAVNNSPFIDRAIKEDMPHVSLIWHPWSLHQFDPGMRMLELTFSYVRERSLAVGTFATMLAQLANGQSNS